MSKNQGILPTHKDYLGECKLETAPIENVLEVGTVNITVTPVQNMCETTANPKVNNLEKISDSKYIQKKGRKEKKNVPVKTPYQKVVTVAPTQIPIATKKAALVPTKQPTKQPNHTNSSYRTSRSIWITDKGWKSYNIASKYNSKQCICDDYLQ